MFPYDFFVRCFVSTISPKVTSPFGLAQVRESVTLRVAKSKLDELEATGWLGDLILSDPHWKLD